MKPRYRPQRACRGVLTDAEIDLLRRLLGPAVILCRRPSGVLVTRMAGPWQHRTAQAEEPTR